MELSEVREYVNQLVAGSEESWRILELNGIKPNPEAPGVEMMKAYLVRLIAGGFLQDFQNSNVIQFFVYDSETRNLVEELNGADGICYWTEDADPVCIIGLHDEIFVNYSEQHIIMIILHELTHGLLRYGEHNHDSVFFNQLDDLILRVNSHLGMEIVNDYAGLNLKEHKQVSLLSNFDGEVGEIRKRHNKRVSRLS